MDDLSEREHICMHLRPGNEAGSGDTIYQSLFIVRVKVPSQYILNPHLPSQLPAHPRAPSAPAPHGTE